MHRYKISLVMKLCSSITDGSCVVDPVGSCFASASLTTVCRPSAGSLRWPLYVNTKTGGQSSFIKIPRTLKKTEFILNMFLLWIPRNFHYVEMRGRLAYRYSWTVRGSNPSRGEIFRTCPVLPWDPPSLLYNGYRVFLGGSGGRGVGLTPTPSSAKVLERVELRLYSP